MTLPSLATTNDLAEWLGEPLGVSDAARAEAVIAAASTLVRSRVGRTWVDDDGNLIDVPAVARSVTVQCAGRVWRNPDAVVHRTTGPFSERYAEQAGQGMWLTKTEQQMLDRLRTPSGGLWVLGTTRGDLETAGPSVGYGVTDEVGL